MILITAGEEPIPFFKQRNPKDDGLVYKEVLEEMAILSTDIKLLPPKNEACKTSRICFKL